MDVWGAIFKAQFAGGVSAYEIERDDGRIETFPSAENYFAPPRTPAECELLHRLVGPVLDLAAGAGSYTLYLQDLGLDVTAADYSPGAMEVCRARGCHKVVPIDLRTLDLDTAAFRTIIVMGNTLGVHQTPDTMPNFLRALRSAVKPRGRLLYTMIDPLDTTDEGHLQYQERNRSQGRPPGLIRIRITHQGTSEPWMSLWMLTDDEVATLASETGWVVIEERRNGPFRTRLLESDAG